MSVFTNTTVPCPACQAEVPFQLVDSVNVTRELTQPGVRASILDHTFQSEQCTGCGNEFRIEPEFSYVDFNHGQFIGVWSSDKIFECSKYEARTLDAFEKSYGGKASEVAQSLGRTLNNPRVVFGWNSLAEKLIAADAGIDDLVLELVKIAIVSDGDVLIDQSHQELVLLGVDEKDGLIFGWFAQGSPSLNEVIKIPRDILGDVSSNIDAWKDLGKDLRGGLFVDYRKLFFAELASA